jgi:hypothetical protein
MRKSAAAIDNYEKLQTYLEGIKSIDSIKGKEFSKVVRQFVIEELVDPNITTSKANGELPKGMTPLMFAAALGLNDLVNELIKKSAVVNLRSSYDDPKGADWAANKGMAATVHKILNNRLAKPEATYHGQSALTLAALAGNTDVVATLLANNADVQMRTLSNNSALSLAVQGGHLDTALVILSSGQADPDALIVTKSGKERSVLLEAIKKGYPDLTIELLKAGATTANLQSGEFSKCLMHCTDDATSYHMALAAGLREHRATVGMDQLKIFIREGKPQHVKAILEFCGQNFGLTAIKDELNRYVKNMQSMLAEMKEDADNNSSKSETIDDNTRQNIDAIIAALKEYIAVCDPTSVEHYSLTNSSNTIFARLINFFFA